MIRGVIFDLGSTLMQFEGVWAEVDRISASNMTAFLNEQGYSVDDRFETSFFEQRKKHWARAEETGVEARVQDALRDTLADLGHSSTDGLLPAAIQVHLAAFEERWRAYPDALATLRTLRSRDLRVGLISNADDVGTVQRLCARLGFAPHLSPILSSAQEPRWRKPDPRIFHLVANEWQIAPHEIAMVGDAPRYDILGANRAGMHGILIDRGDDAPWQQIPEELKGNPEIKPAATITTLAQILDVIGTL